MDFMSTFGLVSYYSTPCIRFITCIWFDHVLIILIFRNNLYDKISTFLILIQQVIVFVPDSSYKLVISIFFVCITVPIILHNLIRSLDPSCYTLLQER